MPEQTSQQAPSPASPQATTPRENATRAQIAHPIDSDSVRALKQGFMLVGTVTLASGTKTVSNPKIRTTSIPMVTYKTSSMTGTLRAVCTDGTLTITSSNVLDASEVHYHIAI